MANQAQNLPVTNRSGSIAAGGTAQDVYTKEQAPRQGFEFQNTSDTDMCLAWGITATATNGIKVPAGALYYRPGPDKIVPQGRMSVYCATTGKTFVCNTW
jgi:hypothetical protein